MSNPANTAPAGWYPDPSGAARQRYWDGTQWTEHYHPAAVSTPPAAQPPVVQAQTDAQSAATDAAPARRRRTGVVLAIVGGSLALVLAMTSIVVWGIVPLVSNASSGSSSQITSSPDWKYDYTEPMLDLPTDYEFEIPAAYDLEVIERELRSEVQNQTESASEVDADESALDTLAFEVFYDAALTKRAPASVSQFDAYDPVEISSRELAIAVPEDSGEFRDIGPEGSAWGLHNEYFLIQHVTTEGELREKPLVTRFTIEHEIAAPNVTFGTEANSGNLTFDWEPVAGASGYIVITSHRFGVDGGRMYQILAETSDTSWSSAESRLDALDYDDAPWVITQNKNMELFDAGGSADNIESGWASDGGQAEVDYGVIATDGTNYSPYNTYDAVETAGTLPYEIAFGASKELKNEGASGYIEGIENVQKTIAFTSLDGTTRSTTAYITLDHVKEREKVWAIPLQGRGTSLGEWVHVLKSTAPDISAAVEQFNAAAEAAAPTTGMPEFTVISAPIDEAAAGLKTPPATDRPVYGTSDFSKFLAQHLIAQTAVIDMSEYAGQPGAPDPLDAAYEAMYQNPYVLGIEGLSLDSSATRLFVEYSHTRAQAEQVQAELAAKVDEVTSSVVTGDMSEAETVTALNNWLVTNAEHDYEALARKDELGEIPDGDEAAWEASGTLLEGAGVCASYAAAFNALANAAGIETVVVAGDVTDGGRHAWNKSRVDGAWTAIDVTWNDSDPQNEFLMIDDSEFVGSAERTEDDRWIDDLLIQNYATG